ncbi:hypothetical protein ACCD11_28495, partial [Variovorax sp. Varisp36]
AVLGYNALVRGKKFVLTKLNAFSLDLHAFFVTGARVQSGSEAVVVPLKKGFVPCPSVHKRNPMR